MIWTSEEVDDASAIIAEFGADSGITIICGTGSHKIEYKHNKNKTKTVNYTFEEIV